MQTLLRLRGVPALIADSTIAFVAERRDQLLAWLALRSGDWLGRDEAAALLWPNHDAASARRRFSAPRAGRNDRAARRASAR